MDSISVPLPIYNPAQDHSPASAASAFAPSIGGYFDRYGDGEARAELQRIPLTGVYWGETSYVTDGTGASVTNGGDYWIAGETDTMLLSQIETLRARVRKRGTLWRTRFPDGARQWKTARFLRMSEPQIVLDRVFKATITCEFESVMTNWHAETPRVFGRAADDETTIRLRVENPGATVYDAVLTMTVTSGQIIGWFVNCEALGIDWAWEDNGGPGLTTGQVLRVDAGRRTVTLDGADGYYGFVGFGSAVSPPPLGNGWPLTLHSAPGWFPIRAGAWTFLFYLVTTSAGGSGGTADIQLEFYPQFA